MQARYNSYIKGFIKASSNMNMAQNSPGAQKPAPMIPKPPTIPQPPKATPTAPAKPLNTLPANTGGPTTQYGELAKNQQDQALKQQKMQMAAQQEQQRQQNPMQMLLKQIVAKLSPQNNQNTGAPQMPGQSFNRSDIVNHTPAFMNILQRTMKQPGAMNQASTWGSTNQIPIQQALNNLKV